MNDNSSLIRVCLWKRIRNNSKLPEWRPNDIHNQIARMNLRLVQLSVVDFWLNKLRVEGKINCLITQVVHFEIGNALVDKGIFTRRLSSLNPCDHAHSRPRPT